MRQQSKQVKHCFEKRVTFNHQVDPGHFLEDQRHLEELVVFLAQLALFLETLNEVVGVVGQEELRVDLQRMGLFEVLLPFRVDEVDRIPLQVNPHFSLLISALQRGDLSVEEGIEELVRLGGSSLVEETHSLQQQLQSHEHLCFLLPYSGVLFQKKLFLQGRLEDGGYLQDVFRVIRSFEVLLAEKEDQLLQQGLGNGGVHVCEAFGLHEEEVVFEVQNDSLQRRFELQGKLALLLNFVIAEKQLGIPVQDMATLLGNYQQNLLHILLLAEEVHWEEGEVSVYFLQVLEELLIVLLVEVVDQRKEFFFLNLQLEKLREFPRQDSEVSD